jgi:hypothetical protein
MVSPQFLIWLIHLRSMILIARQTAFRAALSSWNTVLVLVYFLMVEFMLSMTLVV